MSDKLLAETSVLRDRPQLPMSVLEISIDTPGRIMRFENVVDVEILSSGLLVYYVKEIEGEMASVEIRHSFFPHRRVNDYQRIFPKSCRI